ncbi:hypothetical protein L5515_012865 [Caenorhabditis briggsae]|uniref:Uncharacterized protein n=1 Tax=Caenorhabditis briggsae TaxID=6238 RepID=A0AAE9D7Y0_CAEBR|nr:hypothetical protein L3Y34_005780 [Caenorhabditis briggsae]UMM31357.1 hypothetical protein L5515_012865 [Caenorhabditis briggsae]
MKFSKILARGKMTLPPPAYLSATGHSRPSLPDEAQLRRRNHSVSSQRTATAAAPWMSHHLCRIQTQTVQSSSINSTSTLVSFANPCS